MVSVITITIRKAASTTVQSKVEVGVERVLKDSRELPSLTSRKHTTTTVIPSALVSRGPPRTVNVLRAICGALTSSRWCY